MNIQLIMIGVNCGIYLILGLFCFVVMILIGSDKETHDEDDNGVV